MHRAQALRRSPASPPRSPRRPAAALALAVALATIPATEARAQQGEETTEDARARRIAARTAETLPLITEVVTRGEETSRHYWWQRAGEPGWTATDRALRERLDSVDAALAGPAADVRISKIYRRPLLSRANAATLAGLWGVRRALVGTVTYERLAPVAPLELTGWRARATVELVSTSGDAPEVIRTFTLERAAFDADSDAALQRGRQTIARALADLLARSLSRLGGPVGVDAGERLIGLRGAGSASIYREIVSNLKKLDSIRDVQVRWAAEGLIALEINPGSQDPDDRVAAAVRALRETEFEGFMLAPVADATRPDLSSFTVRATKGADAEAR